jgi:hypothetical protein
MKEKESKNNKNKLGIFVSNNNDNIYIIGDIHGDYQCLVHCLVDLAECCYISKIENNREILEWVDNNETIVIFTGDLIHRQRFENNVLDDECSDIFIIKTLLKLKKNASERGGNIIITAGNHEIMNIMTPDMENYTSPMNIKENYKFFTNKEFIKDFISNSYAWIKVNDILISHGGLCSDYLNYIELRDKNLKEDDIIAYVNEKYRSYFSNYDYKNKIKDSEAFNLFDAYDPDPKSHKHNMFWCREWGYNNINCSLLDEILKKLNCKKMIIAHCPQFLNPEKPQMINFECKNDSENGSIDGGFKLAKIDLGMSRGFDYNYDDEKFKKYLDYNFNRKISILKLKNTNNELTFNYDCIISKKLSCIQYLLLKYGYTEKDWKDNNISSNWLGFKIIQELLEHKSLDKCNNTNNKEYNNKNIDSMMECLLYPVICMNIKLNSIKKYKKLYKNIKI